jgi:ketosteroid isomerase-like protein
MGGYWRSMSRASAEALLYRFVEALDRHDEAALLELVDRDVEFHSLIQEVEGGFRGHEGVRAYLADLFVSFPDLRVGVEGASGTAELAVARTRVSATGGAGGVSVGFADWLAMRAGEGKIVWWGFFRTEAEAVEAAHGRT